MKVEILNNVIFKKEMLPEVVDRIFSICKIDPHFKLKEEIKTVEETIDGLKLKVIKQIKLLSRSAEISEDAEKRIALIKQDIESKQIELLENLGSEL